jgi:hypothetical protein
LAIDKAIGIYDNNCAAMLRKNCAGEISMKNTPLFCKAADAISEMLNDYIFMVDFRERPSDFSRKCILNFTVTMLTSINFIAKSMQMELSNFFKTVADSGKTVKTSAFFAARAKIKVGAFKRLFRITADLAASSPEMKTLKGFRIFAVDGSTCILPNSESNRKEFGTSGGVAAARASVVADVLNSCCIIDAIFSKFFKGEGKLAWIHLENIASYALNCIILFDRGYISAKMLSSLQAKHMNFLFRVKSKWNSQADHAKLNKDQFMWITVKKQKFWVRIAKFKLPSGETEMLITNLGADIFSFSELKELYFKRWAIETNYRSIKSIVQMENFSGTSPVYINQDFYITMMLENLMSFAKIESDAIIQKRIASEGKSLKYAQKTNENILAGTLKNALIYIILTKSAAERHRMCIDFIKEISGFTVPIRPGRSFGRKKKNNNKYPNNQKKSL